MEGQPLDDYEERLYSVFKSFDVNNEEALEESAVRSLCDALQLEERGAALCGTLFDARATAGRVTFSQFRSGLLAVLGDQPAPAPHSDDDSSGREVAPRFVFGSKKYGRRSRPAPGEGGTGPGSPRASSASRVASRSPVARPRARRSASAMEARDATPPLEHDARVDRSRALALCRDLRMDAIDAGLVDRVFQDASATDTTVGEFFERLNATLAAGLDDAKAGAPRAARASLAADLDEDSSRVPVEAVLEAWEAAGVRRPRRLLAELGFTGAAVDGERLECALDEEQPPASGAALALARLRHVRAAARAARLAAERDKLRADVAAGERRAAILAQEMDESQARLEAELRATLRRAESRHAEELRRAASEAQAEAERAAAARLTHRDELARRDAAEAARGAERAAGAARVAQAEARAAAAEEARAAAARDAGELAAALRGAEERAARLAGEAAAADALAVRLEAAARDNARLRERVEELAAELAAPRPAPSPPPAGCLHTELQEAQAAPLDPAEAAAGVETSTSISVHSLNDDDEEKRKLMEVVSELEGALEALRAEYEACEEYWAGKVRSERAAHDADAAAAGARLAELAARVADFERRLRPAPPALPTIAEQAALEAQVAALEAELAAARRRGAGGAARGACARCARTAARADLALRRLAARLQAADLLVKDLYVENCALAARRAHQHLPL